MANVRRLNFISKLKFEGKMVKDQGALNTKMVDWFSSFLSLAVLLQPWRLSLNWKAILFIDPSFFFFEKLTSDYDYLFFER